MLFAVSVTTNCTVTPSGWRFTLPGVTMPPTRNERPCGTSFAATWLGVKKNTRFSWNAASTKAAVTPSATRPPAIIAIRFCLGLIGSLALRCRGGEALRGRCACAARAARFPRPPDRASRGRSPKHRTHSPPLQGNFPSCPSSRGSPRVVRRPLARAFALEHDAARAQQRGCDAVEPESESHHGHAGQHRRRHGRSLGETHRSALMQRVPPLHRKVDDRDVHDADQSERNVNSAPVGAIALAIMPESRVLNASPRPAQNAMTRYRNIDIQAAGTWMKMIR